MNDSVSESWSSSAAALAPGAATAGQLLKQAREAAGVHIAALAVALKVPVSKLEALEHDRLAQSADAVFVRALASSVARTLKIDGRPILELLPQTPVPRLSSDYAGLNAPFKSDKMLSKSALAEPSSKPMVWAVLFLLIGVAVLVVWPYVKPELTVTSGAAQTLLGGTTVEKPAAPGASASEGSVAGEAAPVPPAVVAASPADVSPPMPEAHQVARAASPAVADGRVETTDSATPAKIDSAANAGAAAAAPTLSFKARADSWIKVVDGTGAVALQRTLGAGESADVAVAPPLAVTIGRADVTDVQVRGKAFDLAPVMRENVARFEVK
ncbi:DUF4115 domain-containing protein [Ramlibacter sp. H39-3-26]|nr:DUF4115 domain-containing protein [Ramlibacter sp. H39-3-26]